MKKSWFCPNCGKKESEVTNDKIDIIINEGILINDRKFIQCKCSSCYTYYVVDIESIENPESVL